MTTPAGSTPDVDPTPTATALATTLARWRSRCPSCSKRISAGEAITRFNGRWVHEEPCAQVASAIRPTVARELALDPESDDQ